MQAPGAKVRDPSRVKIVFRSCGVSDAVGSVVESLKLERKLKSGGQARSATGAYDFEPVE